MDYLPGQLLLQTHFLMPMHRLFIQKHEGLISLISIVEMIPFGFWLNGPKVVK
jgi:hypothetical protein